MENMKANSITQKPADSIILIRELNSNLQLLKTMQKLIINK